MKHFDRLIRDITTFRFLRRISRKVERVRKQRGTKSFKAPTHKLANSLKAAVRFTPGSLSARAKVERVSAVLRETITKATAALDRPLKMLTERPLGHLLFHTLHCFTGFLHWRGHKEKRLAPGACGYSPRSVVLTIMIIRLEKP